MTTRTLLLGIPALLLAAACGSSKTGTGTMSVHLVDAPGDVLEINLHVLQVQVHGASSGWVTLANLPATDPPVDLLSLRNGVVATLADGAVLPADRYTQLRLLLGEGNTVKVDDGTPQGAVYPLTVPSGLQSGLKLVCNVDVQPGSAKDVFVDFDGRHSIFVHDTGVPGKYILRPVVFCVEGAAPGATPETAAGTISGRLTGDNNLEATDLPLADVEVTAQVIESGRARIVQTTRTDSNGIYTLELLPLGQSYYVVSLPQTGIDAWPARASGPISLDASGPTGTWTTSFGARADTGSVSGTITSGTTPAASATDPDQVSARQTLDAGGTPRSLIVLRTDASSSGTFTLSGIPVGSYSFSATRNVADGMGGTVAVVSPSVDVTVAPSPTADVTIAFP